MFDKIIQQRNRAKDDCKHYLVDFANRTLAFNKKESSTRYKKYQCPWCGSGTGKHQTGNLTIYMDTPTRCKCLVCGNGGDIYSLVGQIYGLNPETQFGEIVQKVFDEFNVDVPKLGDLNPKEYIPKLVQKSEYPADIPTYFHKVDFLLTNCKLFLHGGELYTMLKKSVAFLKNVCYNNNVDKKKVYKKVLGVQNANPEHHKTINNTL